MTNGFIAPVTLTSITVTAPDGETLLQLDGDDLVTRDPATPRPDPDGGDSASGTVAVVMDVTVPPDRGGGSAWTITSRTASPPMPRCDR